MLIVIGILSSRVGFTNRDQVGTSPELIGPAGMAAILAWIDRHAGRAAARHHVDRHHAELQALFHVISTH
jgi:hypothetical protein